MIGTMRMKRIYYVIIIFLGTFISLKAQTIDGFLKVVENTSTTYAVKLQIRLESGSAILSIATIRFNYDTTRLSFPTKPVLNKDYEIYNFNSPTYSATVTHPSSAIISVNLFSMSGNTITTDTVDVTTISFKKLASFDSATIYPVMVQIFSPSNSTQWAIGTWKDYHPTAIKNIPNVPEKFQLMQNYPNPFNPSTTIEYQISSNSLVTLKIYNVLGQEVATLVDKMESPGNYSVRFNADKLASGTYFYRLQTGEFAQTKKMLLIK